MRKFLIKRDDEKKNEKNCNVVTFDTLYRGYKIAFMR